MSPSSHLNAPKPANPFAHRPSRGRAFEKGVLSVFRAATYLILLCGAVVFADIVFKGVPTVVNGFKTTAHFPYVTNTFLFTAPESLYVFDYEGKNREMGDQEFRAFRAAEEAKATAAGLPLIPTAPTRLQTLQAQLEGLDLGQIGRDLAAVAAATRELPPCSRCAKPVRRDQPSHTLFQCYFRSKRSRSITLVHAAMKSLANSSPALFDA
jgi:phosphate transport system permease protein